MRIGNLFSAVQFFLVVLMCSMGVFFVALPWAPQVRVAFSHFLAQRDDLFFPIGILLGFIGVVLGIGFYFMQKSAYFQVEMSTSVALEKEIVQEFLAHYWKNRFSDDKLKTDVVMQRDRKLELIAELPSLVEGDVEKFLGEIEEEVGRLLVKQLGYKKDFLFTFQIK